MGGRIGYIDFFRGLAIINMIIYHTLYDLKYVFYLKMDFFSIDKWYFYQQYICISFIFLSGFSANFSKKLLKNAFKLMIISIIISIVTINVSDDLAIYFGVLHFLSFSMFAIYFYDKMEKRIFKNIEKNHSKIYIFLGILLNLIIFLYLKSSIYKNIEFYKYLYSIFNKIPFSYIIGFPNQDFYSADYFPIIPWIFLSFLGYFCGKLAKYKNIKDKDEALHYEIRDKNFLGESKFQKKEENILIKFVKLLGKNSLKIYIIHQVIIYGVLYIIFTLFGKI